MQNITALTTEQHLTQLMTANYAEISSVMNLQSENFNIWTNLLRDIARKSTKNSHFSNDYTKYLTFNANKTKTTSTVPKISSLMCQE
jgi:hypothetical protein